MKNLTKYLIAILLTANCSYSYARINWEVKYVNHTGDEVRIEQSTQNYCWSIGDYNTNHVIANSSELTLFSSTKCFNGSPYMVSNIVTNDGIYPFQYNYTQGVCSVSLFGNTMISTPCSENGHMFTLIDMTPFDIKALTEYQKEKEKLVELD